METTSFTGWIHSAFMLGFCPTGKQQNGFIMSQLLSLDPSIQQKIKDLCFEGYQRYDEADYPQALRLFYQAWLLVPKPQPQFEEAGWILTAIGDGYFRNKQFQQGTEALRSALKCPKTDRSAFTHLRLGQCLYELGSNEAIEQLSEAFAIGGEKTFIKEPVKYRHLVKPVARA
ncbi:hypothetical protein NBRC116494_17080 [Aurantivibrio plasticivorans]